MVTTEFFYLAICTPSPSQYDIFHFPAPGRAHLLNKVEHLRINDFVCRLPLLVALVRPPDGSPGSSSQLPAFTCAVPSGISFTLSEPTSTSVKGR